MPDNGNRRADRDLEQTKPRLGDPKANTKGLLV
jgi:hypothetical protein